MQEDGEGGVYRITGRGGVYRIMGRGGVYRIMGRGCLQENGHLTSSTSMKEMSPLPHHQLLERQCF